MLVERWCESLWLASVDVILQVTDKWLILSRSFWRVVCPFTQCGLIDKMVKLALTAGLITFMYTHFSNANSSNLIWVWTKVGWVCEVGEDWMFESKGVKCFCNWVRSRKQVRSVEGSERKRGHNKELCDRSWGRDFRIGKALKNKWDKVEEEEVFFFFSP